MIVLADRGVDRRRPPFFRTKKVAILGNTATIAYAPWRDPSWTLVAHPCCRAKCHREPDWYFDLHGRVNFTKERKAWTSRYYTWLKHLQTPIFMQEAWPEIPMAVRYPLQRILAEFRAYFTNHVAWMIPLALTEGVTHIGVFGCDYKHEQERGKQRGSAEYWLGYFEGHGGHVIQPPGASLLNDPPELYGYESHDEHGKLKSSYRMPVTIPAQTATGQPARAALTILDPAHPESWPPLMPPPPGMETVQIGGELAHA